MDSYSEIVTLYYPNMVVRLHLPDITDEEQKVRMKRVYKATEELLKEKFGGKRGTNRF